MRKRDFFTLLLILAAFLLVAWFLPVKVYGQATRPTIQRVQTTVWWTDGTVNEHNWAAAVPTPPTTVPSTQPAKRGGINLGELRDYDPQCVYADAIRTAEIQLNGVAIAPGTTKWPTGNLRVYLARGLNPASTAGTWYLRIGGGVVAVTATPGAAESVKPLAATEDGDKWWALNVAATSELVGVDLAVATAPSYVRCYRPGIIAAPQTTEPPKFNPQLVEKVKMFPGPVRFMDWLGANGNTSVAWTDQPGIDSLTFAGKGCVADAVALCNLTGNDCWLNLPLDANPDFVRSAAAMVNSALSPDLCAFVETSNEAWNEAPAFPQGKMLLARADATIAANLAIGFDKNRWNTAARIFAEMTAANAELWRASDPALARRSIIVLGCHRENPAATENMLSWLQKRGRLGLIDAIAIAPYMGDSVKAATQPTWTADQYFNGVPSLGITGLLDPGRTGASFDANVQQQLAIAKKYGKRLVAYEMGVGRNGQARWPGVLASQADDRMGTVVARYRANWFSGVGDIGCWYDLASAWKLNSWGATDDLHNLTPKLKAAAATQP